MAEEQEFGLSDQTLGKAKPVFETSLPQSAFRIGNTDRSASYSEQRIQRLPSISEAILEHHPLLRNWRNQSQSEPSDRARLPRLAPRKLIVPGSTVHELDGRRLKDYTICRTTFVMQAPPNEGVAVLHRTTVGGRNLSYRLKVVQQPEKARACGSGPRSSADRRPVDPPPVVSLTIYENGQDITHGYDAGFMLYASLDVARPIAKGRMHEPTSIPVLTGVAVAGIAYLERPKPAGYFIFPDLSVRHEGWYRLRFHLFEQVKKAEDADQDRPFGDILGSTVEEPREPHAHEAMANRLFVSSAPFQVFSAKKFPGLSMSTDFSKIIAEQGCRVRIRREIRQRRKPKGKGDDDDDIRRSGHATPEPVIRPMHDRTLSHDGSDISRRVSVEIAPQVLSRKPSHEQLASPMNAAPMAPPALPTSSPVISSYHQSDHRMYRPDPMPMGPGPMSNIPRTLPQAADHPRTLPSIHALVSAASPSPRPRQYDLPEPVAQKRAHSPRSYGQMPSLKDGARPDGILQATTTQHKLSTTLANVLNYEQARPELSNGPIIEADDGEGDSGSDSEDSILDGPFTYRRADGSRSGRPLVIPRLTP